jgi:hypothetical protein
MSLGMYGSPGMQQYSFPMQMPYMQPRPGQQHMMVGQPMPPGMPYYPGYMPQVPLPLTPSSSSYTHMNSSYWRALSLDRGPPLVGSCTLDGCGACLQLPGVPVYQTLNPGTINYPGLSTFTFPFPISVVFDMPLIFSKREDYKGLEESLAG